MVGSCIALSITYISKRFDSLLPPPATDRFNALKGLVGPCVYIYITANRLCNTSASGIDDWLLSVT